jgi:hypothetical protein
MPIVAVNPGRAPMITPSAVEANMSKMILTVSKSMNALENDISVSIYQPPLWQRNHGEFAETIG